MLITNHVLAGAVIGWVAPSVAAGGTLGFVSHFVLDAAPHFAVDPEHLLRIAVPDGLLGLAVIAVVISRTPPDRRRRVLAGITGGCLPDMDKPGRQFFGRSPYPGWFDDFHGWIQPESARLFPVEVAAATVLVGALAALGRRLERP